jgi:hypothetical protein
MKRQIHKKPSFPNLLYGSLQEEPNMMTCRPKWSLFCVLALSIWLVQPGLAQSDVFANSKCYVVLRSAVTGEGIWLTGSSTIDVSYGAGGAASDHNGNGLDDAATQLTNWTFTGFSSTHGTVQMRLRGGTSSAGLMEEQANNTPGTLDVSPFTPTGSVSSSLDVMLEWEMDGKKLYNTTPKHMSGFFANEPPATGEFYQNDATVTLFVDGSGNPSGYAIGLVQYYPYVPVCGDWRHPNPIGDLNGDCMVNFVDIAMLSLHWLECTSPDCDPGLPS